MSANYISLYNEENITADNITVNGTIDLSNPLYDEPWTAENWWAADVSASAHLPSVPLNDKLSE